MRSFDILSFLICILFVRALSKFKKYFEAGLTGIPGQAVVTLRSIILAQQEGRTTNNRIHDISDWKAYPSSPRLKMKDYIHSAGDRNKLPVISDSLNNSSTYSDISGGEGSVHTYHSEALSLSVNLFFI